MTTRAEFEQLVEEGAGPPTRERLEKMNMSEIIYRYGIRPRIGTTKAALIERVLVAHALASQGAVKPVVQEADGTIHTIDVPRVLTNETITTGNLTTTTITHSKPLNPSVSATVPYIDVPRYGAKQGRPLPAIVIRTPDGPQVTWTPLGSGIWREENTATGDVRECDGGLDATWDGTTLVIANFYADEWGHPAPFDPLIAPYVEVPDAADAE